MSAYIVEDKTINTVTNWIAREVQQDGWLKSEIEELGFKIDDPDFHSKLAQALFDLNVAGVFARYGDNEDLKDRKSFKYELTESAEDHQVLKSLECLVYQCAEGDVPGTPLYKFLDNICMKHLLQKIVRQSKFYEMSIWG